MVDQDRRQHSHERAGQAYSGDRLLPEDTDVEVVEEVYRVTYPETGPARIRQPAEQPHNAVSVIFKVTVPEKTDSTGKRVFLAGTLDRLSREQGQWNPGEIPMTRLDATHWTLSLAGMEGTQIEYKYTLGDWDHVEKGKDCSEIQNHKLTLKAGKNDIQIVNDTVIDWRSVTPCGW